MKGSTSSTAAAPATLLGFAGDFFSPRSGWLLVAFAGVASLALALLVLWSLGRYENSPSTPFWHRWIVSDEDTSWMWSSRPALKAHGVHVLLIFGAASLFSAHKSYAAKDEGGYLAQNIPLAAAMQEQVGISRAMLEEQKKQTGVLTSIDTKASNFKKETSEDPRKELANAGVPWDGSRFNTALRDGDLRNVQLFLAGGMRIKARDALDALERPNTAVLKLLAGHRELFNPGECLHLLSDLQAAIVLHGAEDAKQLVNALCSNDPDRAVVREKGAAFDGYFRQSVASYQEQLAARPTVAACSAPYLARSFQSLREDAVRTLEYRAVSQPFTREDLFAAEVVKAKNVQEAQAAVHRYCEQRANEQPTTPDDSQVRKWKTLGAWLG